jgi:soluble lytic murein transglycosylase-like protein
MKNIEILGAVLIVAIVLNLASIATNGKKNQEKIAALAAEVERLSAKQAANDLFIGDFHEMTKNDIMRLETAIEENRLPENYTAVDTENVLTIIRLVCDWQGFDYRLAYATAIHESGLDPAAVGHNTDGSTDYGLYQFNDIALEAYAITPEIALNPYTATVYYIAIMERLIGEYGLYDALRAYAAGERGMSEGGGYAYANDMYDLLGIERTGKE